MTLWHGGIAGLRRGDEIVPGMAEHRHVEGCPVCEAHKRGKDHPFDPQTPGGRVYATTNRRYARWYASRAVRGDLYRVEPTGPMERSEEDHFPTWWCRSLRVVTVVERRITLTWKERKDLFRRWGGTEEEFAAMVAATIEAFSPPKKLPDLPSPPGTVAQSATGGKHGL